MKQFISIVKRLLPYRVSLFLSILFNILVAAFTVIGIPLFIPFFQLLFNQEVKTPVDTNVDSGIGSYIEEHFTTFVADRDPLEALTIVIILFVAVFLFKNVFRYFSHFFMAPVRTGFVRDLRKEVFEHLIELPLRYHKSKKKGDILSSMSMDILEVESSVLNIMITMVRSPLIILGSIGYMMYVNVNLTLLVLILIPFTVFIIGGISKRLKQQSLNAQTKLGQILAIVEESLGGLKILKSFNAIEKSKRKFQFQNDQHRSILKRVLWRRDLGSPISEFLGIVTIALLMFYAGRLVFSNELPPETFFTFIYAFFMIIEPSKNFSSAYFSYQKGIAAMDRINNILMDGNIIFDRPEAVSKTTFEQEIRFSDVWVRHPGKEDYALQKIDLVIPKGQKLAIVGLSGAGKTTLADLIPRFFDSDRGSIFIDGVDTKDIKVKSLRDLVGLVTQEAILFNDTIRNNISIGSDANQEEIERAAQISNCSEFISSLPQKYDHIIGDQGGRLSGGQKQRLALARAILKDAPILILDEATSALDSESEQKVQKALKNALVNRTAIIIAHRLSTIQEADIIVVLKNGEIEEMGNHRNLIEKKGEYYKFVQLQALGKN